MSDNDLAKEINSLKTDRDAIILAHNYQPDEVQAIADHTGDSYALSKLAAETIARVIVFCGVHFMAESAAILAPDKTVLLPEPQAGCPLADSITAEALRERKNDYPGAAVVAYINSSAEVKALSDCCCTSSNAVKVVNSLVEDQVILVPDKNLAAYVASRSHKEIIPWEGCCPAHDQVVIEDLQKARRQYPGARVAVHPECRPELLAGADFVGSTSEIISYARSAKVSSLIVGTEVGTFYQLKKDNPGKKFYLLSDQLVCPTMKLTSLKKIKIALEKLSPVVTVPENTGRQALAALGRMLQIG